MQFKQIQKYSVLGFFLLIGTLLSIFFIFRGTYFQSSLLTQEEIQKSIHLDWQDMFSGSGSLQTQAANKILSHFSETEKSGMEKIFSSILGNTFSTYFYKEESSSASWLGKTSSGQKIGIIFNDSISPQRYTLYNAPDVLQIRTLSPRTATGSILRDTIFQETQTGSLLTASGSMLTSPFEWGVNTHPLGTYPYLDISIDKQHETVRDLAMGWIRFDYAGGGKPGCDPNCLLQEILQKKGNLKLSIPIFPNDNVFQGGKIKLADETIVYRRDDGVIVKEDGVPYTGTADINAGTPLTKADGTAVYAYSLGDVEANAAWYGEAIAASYKGKVEVWEMNNELNAFTFARTLALTNWKKLPPETIDETKVWDNPGTGVSQDYNSKFYNEERYQRVLAQLKGLSRGIRKGDPNAKIALNSAGIFPAFFEKIIADGVDFDIIQLHEYGEIGSIEEEKEMLREGLRRLSTFGKEIYIGEGNHVHGSYSTENGKQEEYLKTILPFIHSFYPLVKGYFFYELLDEPLAAVPWEQQYGLFTVRKSQEGTYEIGDKKDFLNTVEKTMQEINTSSPYQINALSEKLSALPLLQESTITANTQHISSITIPAHSFIIVSDRTISPDISILLGDSATYFQYLLRTFPSLKNILISNIADYQTPELESLSQNANTLITPQQNTNTNKVIPISQTSSPSSYSSAGSGYPLPRPIQSSSNTDSLKASAPQQSPFQDIKGNFAETAIIELYTKGIVTGRTSGLFHPSALLNRAEAASLMTKAYFSEEQAKEFLTTFKKTHPTYTYMFFQDVSLKAWYAGMVGIMKDAGIIRGASPSFYEPERNITRAEYLKIVLEARKIFSPANEIPSNLPKDIKASDWFAPYVSQGIYQSLIDRKQFFEPHRFITRAEAAKILYMALKK